MSFGFFILRHVSKRVEDQYWKEAYRCVRLYYPDAPIVIIDDNSTPGLVDEKFETTNTTVVRSDLPRRGELLFYHFFLRLRPFEIAVFIHDTVFFNSFIDFSGVATYKMLWEFEHNWDEPIPERALLRSLTNAAPLLQLYEQRDRWKGCFGCMCVIAYQFLAQLDAKYSFKNLALRILTRHARKCLERVIGCMLAHEGEQVSMLGNIHDYSPGSYTVGFEYRHLMVKLPVIKVWAGR